MEFEIFGNHIFESMEFFKNKFEIQNILMNVEFSNIYQPLKINF
jgi:hypothetical protein